MWCFSLLFFFFFFFELIQHAADIRNYKKQRNYVVNLNKEAKLDYFSKYESDDNKPFWVRCKPYFTNKHSKADTDIMLSENGELILKNKEIANTFNDHFGSIVDNLGLDHWEDHSLSPTKGVDRIDNIIKRYKNHPSTKNIKQNVAVFAFSHFSQFLWMMSRQLFEI